MTVRSRLSIGSIDIVSPTIEAVIMTGISGALAQAFTAYPAKDPFAVDITHILHYMLFTAVTAAPNLIFQTALEQCLPTRTTEQSRLDRPIISKDEFRTEALLARNGQLSIRNTIIKFLLDQSLSATTNTMLFIVVLGWIKGHSLAYIQDSLSKDFWPMLQAGYRFWPMVCLVNLVMVPMEYRPMVGNAAGLVWGIFMSLW